MSSLPRILIAEDEMLVSMVLEEMLEEMGYEVECASNLDRRSNALRRQTM